MSSLRATSYKYNLTEIRDGVCGKIKCTAFPEKWEKSLLNKTLNTCSE